MPLDANALGQQQWYDRLKGALTLQPYLNPMQPVDMARGLWNSLVQYPHDVYTGQAQATPEGATKFALSTFSGGPGMAVKGAVGSAGGRLGAEAMGAAQPAQPWFSALAKGVEAAPVNKASGDQWLGTLKNMPGIKPEELQWTGFQDWLKGKPSVTKQEATDFLNQNQVNLQEVVKGKPDTAELDALTVKHLSGGLSDQEFQRYQDLITQRQADPTKFHQYQLPGGENYRELLLTLPTRSRYSFERDAQNRFRVIDENGKWVTTYPGGTMTNEQFAEMLDKQTPYKADNFRSAHYDEPNILAHVRFNDRVDAAGKKTLFLEEVQSDWHQKGRKQGYINPEADKGNLSFIDYATQLRDKYGGVGFLDRATPAEVEQYNALRSGAGQKTGMVPDAPFKTTWPDLALKRMIKYAVDNGYDSVSWTPGKVQAERYDLSKHLDSIVYQKRGELYNIAAYPKKGSNAVWNNQSATLDDIEAHLGKEMAEKIANGGGNPKGGFNWLENLDLRVGGEGMNAFYDKMLPAAANKLGKKYGAKVGVTQMRADTLPEWSKSKPHTIEAWTLPITDAMRKEVGAKGQPLFTGGTPLGAAAMGQQQQMSPDQMRAYLMGNQS